jgi:signal transduction histidine kinase
MNDKNTEAAYRLTVIRIGIALTWVALGAYTWFVADNGPPPVDERLPVLIGAWAGVLVLTFVPWQWLLARLFGDLLVLTWLSAIAIAVIGLPELHEPQTLVFVLLSTAAFSTATLPSWPVAVSSVLIILGGFIGAEVSRFGDAGSIEAPRMVGFAVTLGIVVLGQVALSRRVRTANTRLADAERAQLVLSAREAELDQVYSVSRTIGTGRDLAEVLPELVGRVVSAVGARMGAVLLHDAESAELRLMSPIWSSGVPLKADPRRLPVSNPGLAQKAFRENSPLVLTDATKTGDHLLMELDESDVAAIPLSAGTETIGILLIGDTRDEPFDADDLATMQSLAGPAALVLNQLARYEEARAMSEQMSELAQLKTDFVSVVSHELRTPLTSIIGSLHTLQRPQFAPEDPDGRTLLDTAARQADRLKALIEDLLVVSRIDNRALPVRPEKLDLRLTVNTIVDSIPGAAQFTTVHVEEEARDAMIDPEHLRRILTNLIENALRYAPRAPVKVNVIRNAGEALIRVADEGPGIPPGYVDKIFERFVQVGRKSEQGRGGTGLGLSIVRGLAEAMGGRVWYEQNAYHVGAIFVVAIPMRAGSRKASV